MPALSLRESLQRILRERKALGPQRMYLEEESPSPTLSAPDLAAKNLDDAAKLAIGTEASCFTSVQLKCQCMLHFGNAFSGTNTLDDTNVLKSASTSIPATPGPTEESFAERLMHDVIEKIPCRMF